VASGSGLAGYQFEDCRLDLERGCLVRHDTEYQLRYQTFQVLLYFAQHPGVLVTKEELIAAVWKQSYVSSNALVQCIAELRRILDDDSRIPHFIKTVPRHGYRFLPCVVPCERVSAPVPEAVVAYPDASLGPALDAQGLDMESPPLDIAKPPRWRHTGWISTVCVFTLVLAGGGLAWRHSSSGRGLAIAAVQRQKIETTAPVPNRATQANPDESSQETPEELKTNDPEALLYYSLGVEKAHAFQNTEAIGLLKKAVARDPHFAMAYARIGYAYAVSDFVPEQGRPYLGKASEMATHLPEKNKLYIQAWSAVANADYVRAAAIFNQIIRSYPDENEAYYQLARLLEGQERSSEAISVLKRGLENQPSDSDLYNALGLSLLNLNQAGKAIDAEQHYVALSPQDPNSHDSLGMVYQRAGKYAAAISEYDSALALDPEFEPSIVHLGDVAFEQGRYREAVRQYQRYIQVVHSNDARAIGYGDIATVYRALGDHVAAEKAAANELKNNPNAVWNSLLLASDENEAHTMARFEQILLAHSPNHERGIPPDLRTQLYNRAYLDLMRGDLQLAIAQFKAALQHHPPSSAIDLHEDCLANAYLQAGMYDEAVVEYQRILRLNPNYPLAQYHLGEAYARMGDQTRAHAMFAQFLQTWKSADQDLPEVAAAKTFLVASSPTTSAAADPPLPTTP
jgi:tetratricopeptide (TPR) repeat protein/DNA-binding winged helix-turn-helix (wHTH) protein